ncbi:amino acid permease [Sporomusa acidovorans]|uniref:GABA permease n=1 Tax=Sporomusa acidovorans (strain ATCC 49682 / DSM 3132 / Mol) TaxID=1123286 RepID=A0ABZ3IWP3_SPOA4|nr:amino acid permease [Sporomusa acidovorans]OZC23589.1 GABA permease [Sporomusa acidovorans DSM 3132]SDE21839.1 amino acid transporter, AAT family [Sporomusa acidovorans]
MKHTGDNLSAWQLTIMALGTVIGGSFFLGSAVAIRAAGPAIVLAFVFGGVLVYAILYALSEMTVADPAPGSFRTFAERAFGPAVGFVVGWVYWIGLVLAMSSEAIAVSALLQNWLPGTSLPLLGATVIILVTVLNLLGADRLSKLEGALSAIKLLAIIGFVVLGAALIGGVMPGQAAVRAGALATEPLLPSGIGGVAGSMLIVMFAYAGFEIIGLAASETTEPDKTVPRAITYTVISLVGLYVSTVIALLLLVPTQVLTTEQSPLVTALAAWNLNWAGNAINSVLATAILSTMLAAMFGLGRMLRSLAEEGHAPVWLRDGGDIPYKGIVFSGVSMLIGLGLGLLLPAQVYLFLVSSGGFSLLFSYMVILLTHYKLRKLQGCPPRGKCQLPGFPVTSWAALGSLALIIASMPLIPGQGAGMFAGLGFVALFSLIYIVTKRLYEVKDRTDKKTWGKRSLGLANMQFETAAEIAARDKKAQARNSKRNGGAAEGDQREEE